jgi:hypothetical protein
MRQNIHRTPRLHEGMPSFDADTSRSITERLGSELRDMYASLQPEPLPDQMSDLLKRLQKSVHEK